MIGIKYFLSALLLFCISPLVAQESIADQLRLEELMLKLFKTNITEIAETLTKAIGDKEIQQEVEKKKKIRSQRPASKRTPARRRPSFGRSRSRRPSLGRRPAPRRRPTSRRRR